jgi:hypothetical protein
MLVVFVSLQLFEDRPNSFNDNYLCTGLWPSPMQPLAPLHCPDATFAQ